jgi:uncharacterized DUF497 family protein
MYIHAVKYSWDEAKNRANIARHSIAFGDAVSMFDLPMLRGVDKRFDYGEERWVGIGFLKGIVAVVVFTEDDDRDEIRIISVRKATSNESKRFKETIGY